MFREAVPQQFPGALNDNVKLDYQGRIQIFTYVLPFAYVLCTRVYSIMEPTMGCYGHGGHALLAATTGL